MPITIQHLFFYVFSFLAIGSAVLVVTQNNPVRAALFLVVTFISSAALWLMVNAEFLALILVLVYVGAVMTLFLFVVMMLNIDQESSGAKKIRHFPIMVAICAGLVALIYYVMPHQFWSVETIHQAVTDVTNTEALGVVLYTDYLPAFEIAAFILLVAMIAAVTLTHRELKTSKRQNILKQVMVRVDECVELKSIDAEKQ